MWQVAIDWIGKDGSKGTAEMSLNKYGRIEQELCREISPFLY